MRSRFVAFTTRLVTGPLVTGLLITGLLITGLLITGACGGPAHGTTPSIETLRRRAQERPDDAIAQRALAEGELLLRQGDAARARAQIDRALELSPNDLGLLYLRATEREIHGDLAAAFDGYLDVIERARTSDDPMAPTLAEVCAVEIEGLDDAVPDYSRTVAERLGQVHAQPGRITDGARSSIGDLLIDVAYRMGNVERVNELSSAQRCITEWRVAGPIGPRHLLGFDVELAPDRDARLANTYDLGPGRGERETRTLHGRGCNVHLGGGPAGGGGATFAEANVSVPTGGRWVLRLETPNAVALFVDGEEVDRIDRRATPSARASYHALELSAGGHQIRVKVVTRHPNPILNASLSQTAGTPGGDPLEGQSLTADYARVQLAMSRGDIVTARERARAHIVEDGSSTFLIAGAAATLNDPLRDSSVRHDTARRLLSWAAARDEDAYYPRLALGQLEANEGRDLAAIEAMQEGSERWPNVVMFPLQLVDYLERRGWHGQAAQAVAHARRAVPTACRPLRAELGHARRRHQAQAATEHATALRACDARSDAMLTLHVLRREWDEALAEVARMAALEPDESTLGELQARLNVARGRGDTEGVQRLLASVRERMPQAWGLALHQADLALAAGNAQGAQTHLQSELLREPDAMAELRRPLRAIGGESPLESYRRDGTQIIRAYEESDREYTEPRVLVFDYTVYRVFQDGSMLELTHNIFRLQSQESIDAMGEYSVPEGAQMLTLHTVKQDGTRLEPDEIASQNALSFPSLAPGDYIELEYYRAHAPPAGYPNGFVGDRFYFRNFETPFDLSQLTVVTPRDVELTLERRGPAPETEMSIDGETRVYRWTERESRPLRQEPLSVPSREFFPSIYWGRSATWALYVESLRDVLADRETRDPAAVRLVAEIIGDDHRATSEMRARRIYSWVVENIEGGRNVFGSAPAMVAARSGDRTRVLRYLLVLAGLDAELGLARSFVTDHTDGELPDDDTYQHLVVRMTGDDGPVWLHAAARYSPFGFVPPNLSGMRVLMLNAAGEHAEIAARDPEQDLRTVSVDVDLRSDGGARVTVVERFRGSDAVEWRGQLDEIPEADLEQQFESVYISNLLPGGRLTRLRINGREEADAPLVLRYEVELATLARMNDDTLVVPPVFRARLGPQYAPVASRELTQLVGGGTSAPPVTLDVEVRYTPPVGMTVAAAPDDASLTSIHGARVSSASEREGDELIIERQFRVPRMRIAPSEYPAFAEFCRAADAIESAEIRVQ